MSYTSDDSYQSSIDKARTEARRLEGEARQAEKLRAEQAARDKELEKELGEAYGMLRDPMHLFLQSIEDTSAEGVLFKLSVLDDDSPAKQAIVKEATERANDEYRKLPGTPAFPQRTLDRLYQNALNEVASEAADGTLLLGKVEGQRLRAIADKPQPGSTKALMAELEGLKLQLAQAIADGLE